MKPNLLLRLGIVSFSCLLPLRAAESDLREQLRDALYTEEVTRDPEKAAKQYEQILARHDEQQAFAASALFRLAEVRRKQNRKDDAVALYQRLIAEFPKAEAETRLAKENLAALGGKMPSVGMTVEDPEELELRRLEKLLKSSPDLVNQDELSHAVKVNRIKLATWLIQVAKVDLAQSHILVDAAGSGHVKMIEKLMELAGEPLKPQMPEAMETAISEGYYEVVRSLLRLGADPNVAAEVASILPIAANGRISIAGGRPLICALRSGHFRIADLLLEARAEAKSPEGDCGVTPLIAAAANPDPLAAKYVELLIDLGADLKSMVRTRLGDPIAPGQTNPEIFYTPLQVAVSNGAWASARALVARGTDLKNPELFRFIHRGRMNVAESLRFLIEAGAPTNLPLTDGITALAWAVNNQNVEMVRFLLTKGANPNVPIKSTSENDKQTNLVQQAALQRNAEILRLLLDAGGDPTFSPYGEWLLRCVAGSGNDEGSLACIKLLVEKGLVPEPSWRKEGFRGAKTKTLAYLKERFPDDAVKTESKSSN